jgi:IS5 family transposase
MRPVDFWGFPMRSKNAGSEGQIDLFGARLADLLNSVHPLFVLAGRIDWQRFEAKFGIHFADAAGRPALPTRLMVGLEYLKYTFNESDESVVDKFVENPYWQYFCGLEHFTHKRPCHPTSLVKWRGKVGMKGCELMLAETLGVAKRSKLATEESLAEVYVDTTVQPKAVAYPRDSRLLDTARRTVARAAGQLGIKLKQTYVRLGRRALLTHARAMHRGEKKLARRQLKKLRTYLGRVVRDFERKLTERTPKIIRLLGIVTKILGQKPTSKHKIYSVHAPEVVCIAKGKARVKYEFGSKVSVASAVKGSWVIGVNSFPSAPFDGHTIPDVLMQIKSVTGAYPKAAYCDRGYQGSAGHIFSTHVYVQGKSSKDESDRIKKKLLSRAGIEPVIGHMKIDHRLGRNFLLGLRGDQFNAVMAGCGFNLRKLWRAFFLRVFATFLELVLAPRPALCRS